MKGIDTLRLNCRRTGPKFFAVIDYADRLSRKFPGPARIEICWPHAKKEAAP